MTKKHDLTERVLDGIRERRERQLSGKVNCIPWGLPRFEQHNPGIEKGKYYLITANSKVGKTQITDFLFVFNVAKMLVDGDINMKVKIFYFSLEMTKEEKMLAIFANILNDKEGIRLSPTDLKSTRKDKVLSAEVLELLEKYNYYFKKIEEIVEFIDDVRNGYGMFVTVKNYMEANGITHMSDYTTTIKDAKGKSQLVKRQRRDYYEPNDPEEYVMMIIDHIGLINTESRDGVKLDLRESIALLSSDYLLQLRNFFQVIPVVIQQQASAQESVENLKANRLKPTLDGLGDNKTTQRDANVILGLFSPFRHEIPQYMGYDIRKFRDNIRFLEIIGGREGGAGEICPLYFDGAVNDFKELPYPEDRDNIHVVYDYISKFRTI